MQCHVVPGPSARTASRDHDLASSLKEFLTARFLNEHSLTELSREFGANANKLMMVFRQAFGKSIFEYLDDLRMDYAQSLLRDANVRVNEVARILGYQNSNHFSTAFKRKFGVNPTIYKRVT